MKKSIVLALVFVMVFSFLSMTVALTKVSAEEGLTIGFSLGTLQQERWQREVEMAKEYAEEHGHELIVQSCERDAMEQVRQVENMIMRGIDVLLISAYDSKAAGAVVEPAHEAGVPVVSYERPVFNGDLDFHAGFDTVKVGQLQAEMLVERFPKGNYIWLLGGPEEFNAYLLKDGQTEVLTPYIESGDINIVTQQWCKGWDPEEALKHTENALTKVENDVVAVVASNDGTAGGAIQALDGQGLAGKVGVSGQDATLAAIQRVVEGTQTGTVYKPLKELNTKALDLCVALARGETDKAASMADGAINNGEKIVPTIWVDVHSVTSEEEVIEKIIKTGFHSLEDVYRNIPEDQWPEI